MRAGRAGYTRFAGGAPVGSPAFDALVTSDRGSEALTRCFSRDRTDVGNAARKAARQQEPFACRGQPLADRRIA